MPVLSGAGLYVEDADHQEVFLMNRAKVTLVTEATTDYAQVVLEASYLAPGVEHSFQNGGRRERNMAGIWVKFKDFSSVSQC